MPTSNHLAVERTARFFTLGELGTSITDVWFCCHGYGQLAADFAAEFTCIEAINRLIVVPEALSRFYVAAGPGFHAADAKIGATWMTREDRDIEIVDYVNYLDALYERVLTGLDRDRVRITVLGFSQGGSTASRWLTRGKARADRLVMWGSLLASDTDLDKAAELFGRVELTIVYGKRDQFANSGMIAGYEAIMRDKSIPYNLVTFEGGHRMDREILRQLASARAPGIPAMG